MKIRVVNAFRHGMDSQQLQQATSNPNIQRVLQKQASLSKRLSTVAQMSEHQITSLGVGGAGGGGAPATTTVAPPGGVRATAAAAEAAATRIKLPETSYSYTETAV